MKVRKYRNKVTKTAPTEQDLARWRALGREILHKLTDQSASARDIGRVIEQDEDFGDYVAHVASRLYEQELNANAVVRAVVMLGTSRLATLVNAQGWQQEFAL